jgi:LAO/AO transport system kinase
MSVTESKVDSNLWIPPINKTVATEGKGIAELAESIAKHVAYLLQSGDWAARDRARLQSDLEALIREELMNRFLESVQQDKYDEVVEKVLNRDLSPYEAVKVLVSLTLSRRERGHDSLLPLGRSAGLEMRENKEK